MKDEQPKSGKQPAAGLIGEMMLARTVLEEKNELLERKDHTILDLQRGVRRLEEELEELRAELGRLTAEGDEAREAGRREGEQRVIAEVVRLAAEHLPNEPDSWDLPSRLLRHFQDRYGLEVIERARDGLDPERHQVIEVVGPPQGAESSVEVLVPGFRLGGRTVQPALVRVVRGGSSWPA